MGQSPHGTTRVLVTPELARRVEALRALTGHTVRKRDGRYEHEFDHCPRCRAGG